MLLTGAAGAVLTLAGLYALRADVALVRCEAADSKGNLVYNKTARNFSPIM